MFIKWVFKVFTVRLLLSSRTISWRVDFPSKLKGLSSSCFHKVGLWNACHQVCSPLLVMPIPKLDPKRCELGVMIPRCSSSLLTICGRVGTQVGPWKASVGGHDSKMAFKSSFHLWPFQYLSWTLKGVSWGSRPKMVFKSSHHLWPCWYLSWNLKRC